MPASSVRADIQTKEATFVPFVLFVVETDAFASPLTTIAPVRWTYGRRPAADPPRERGGVPAMPALPGDLPRRGRLDSMLFGHPAYRYARTVQRDVAATVRRIEA